MDVFDMFEFSMEAPDKMKLTKEAVFLVEKFYKTVKAET